MITYYMLGPELEVGGTVGERSVSFSLEGCKADVFQIVFEA